MSAKTKTATSKRSISKLRPGNKVVFTVRATVEEIVAANKAYPNMAALNGDLKVVRVKCINGPWVGIPGLTLADIKDELDHEVAPSWIKRLCQRLVDRLR